MNPEQAKIILTKRYGLHCKYWAPEIVLENFDYLTKEIKDRYRIPLMVLIEEYLSFKKRILKEIVDDWLSPNIFRDIAKECVELLKEMYNPQEWQKLLIIEFENMIA